MTTQRIGTSELFSIDHPRTADAESRMSLDPLCVCFARNQGLPFAGVLTEARIRDTLDEHGVGYRAGVVNPVATIWGLYGSHQNCPANGFRF
jgi:hypothetical protein